MWWRLVLGLVAGGLSNSRELQLGVERFVHLYGEALRGQRLAVVTHAAARLPDGRLSVELLREYFHVVAIWAPEHGFWGTVPAGMSVPDDSVAGLPVLSLYGLRRQPTAELFQGVDAVVIELQDIGIRPYTYLSTLLTVMAACAERGIPVYVLDRPNPLGGTVVEGAVLDTAVRSFVGMVPIPYRHGCTLGELAHMANEEGWLSPTPGGIPRRCSLTVVPLQGWKRTMVWEETGLPWFPPSPNIPTPTAARAAVITGVFGEMGLWNLGVGGPTPFQLLGDPHLPAEAMVEQLRDTLRRLGVCIGATRFVPSSGPHARQECRGVFFVPEARHDVRLFEAFTVVAAALRQFNPGLCQRLGPRRQDMVQKVLGSATFAQALCRGEPLTLWKQRGMEEFLVKRQRYVLYR